ncbi:MAG TPA: galactokinase family protein [Candidatus Bathyarchaeia archaeon]|nr:galactokinase family protein [Candidatus Bathyarchaeia archaeon]
MEKLIPFTVNAPGRVFLLGEHSDYLSLEVISAALDLYITFSVKPRDDLKFNLNYQDLNSKDSFSLNDDVTYSNSRDYVRSAFNILFRKEIIPKTGADIIIKGTIPIAAGLSSSSALSVASIITFAHLANVSLSKYEIAQYAFEAEVVEFGESGGMMDHLSSVFGGIIHVDFGDEIKLTQIPTDLTGLVIGDSLEKKKDTVGDLKIIRTNVENGYSLLKKSIKQFNHRETSLAEILNHINKIPEPSKTMTLTTIKNRDLTRRAFTFLMSNSKDEIKFGKMLYEIHELMRDGLKRSTDKIENMIRSVKEVGAFGAKINGSGKGGTILAYAPGFEQEVANAILSVGGQPYIVKISEGATLTSK